MDVCFPVYDRSDREWTVSYEVTSEKVRFLDCASELDPSRFTASEVEAASWTDASVATLRDNARKRAQNQISRVQALGLPMGSEFPSSIPTTA